MYTDASLAHIDAVNSRLSETQVSLQDEIDSLQRELSTNQDPEKMQLIQEMISVRSALECLGGFVCLLGRSGLVGSDVAYQGEGNGV